MVSATLYLLTIHKSSFYQLLRSLVSAARNTYINPNTIQQSLLQRAICRLLYMYLVFDLQYCTFIVHIAYYVIVILNEVL